MRDQSNLIFIEGNWCSVMRKLEPSIIFSLAGSDIGYSIDSARSLLAKRSQPAMKSCDLLELRSS